MNLTRVHIFKIIYTIDKKLFSNILQVDAMTSKTNYNRLTELRNQKLNKFFNLYIDYVFNKLYKYKISIVKYSMNTTPLNYKFKHITRCCLPFEISKYLDIN